MSLRLNIKTDYAIRILTELHIRQGESTGGELSDILGVSYEYFQKVILELKRAGFVASVRGRKGGYRLRVKGDQISVYDVIVQMEGEICIDQCLEHRDTCREKRMPEQLVCQYLNELQEIIVENLKRKRISDFSTS